MNPLKNMNQYQRAYITVDLDAIENNIKMMQKKIKKGTGIVAVIKADGYGHGSVAIAKALSDMEGMIGFAVATYEEALELTDAGITLPILILGYTFPYTYESIIKDEIRPTVFRMDTLEELNNLAIQLGTKVKVHIKVDTGMSRIGIHPDKEGLSFIKKASCMKGIFIEGIFTHFARADEIDKSSALNQLAIFNEFVSDAEKMLGYQIPYKHCSNSAATLEMKDANKDFVRAGITLYGLWPSDEINKENVLLKPALSFYSHVVYVKEIKKGTEVSYGGTYKAPKDIRVATIPVGYADGYPRALSNKGWVIIDGKKCPIIGKVCMDQFMVDVTEVQGIHTGDLVTLIGKDGENSISCEELGALSGRFNYELVCNLNKRVPRIYIKNGIPSDKSGRIVPTEPN